MEFYLMQISVQTSICHTINALDKLNHGKPMMMIWFLPKIKRRRRRRTKNHNIYIHIHMTFETCVNGSTAVKVWRNWTYLHTEQCQRRISSPTQFKWCVFTNGTMECEKEKQRHAKISINVNSENTSAVAITIIIISVKSDELWL